jgi:hypothetical protein
LSLELSTAVETLFQDYLNTPHRSEVGSSCWVSLFALSNRPAVAQAHSCATSSSLHSNAATSTFDRARLCATRNSSASPDTAPTLPTITTIISTTISTLAIAQIELEPGSVRISGLDRVSDSVFRRVGFEWSGTVGVA